MSTESSSAPRWFAAIGAVVVVIIGGVIAIVATRHATSRPLTLDEARRIADHKRWDGKPRGRVFIETPMNLTGVADLDSVGKYLTQRYQSAASRVARPISDDSVKAIERFVNTLPGERGPRERLARADAEIGVMTLVNLAHDSLRVVIALQRVVDAPPNLRALGKVVETWPIVTVMEPIAKRNAVLFRASSELGRALGSMRSCDVEDHIDPRLPPWCWSRENVADVVPGYFERSHVVRMASR